MTEYRIATSVLEDIVRGSLAGDKRLKFHSPPPLARTRAIDITVEGSACDVVVQLDAHLGELLPAVATDVRTAVAAALGRITGLTVNSVDVVFAAVYPSND